MGPLSPDMRMSPIEVEIPSPPSLPSFAAVASPTNCDMDLEAAMADEDSHHSTHSAVSTDSGHGSLDFTCFSSRLSSQNRRQRRGRHSSGAVSTESGVMSPESISIDDEETLMSPPIIAENEDAPALRRKQLSGNSDDGFMEELESLSPLKDSAVPSAGIFSLLNAPIISNDDFGSPSLASALNDEDEEEEKLSSFTQLRQKRSSPVRQFRSDSCPCPFSPVVEEATPIFDLEALSQPASFSPLEADVSQPAVSQSRSSLLRHAHSFKRPEPPRHDEAATPLHSCKRRKSVASPFDLRKPSAASSFGVSKGVNKLAVRSYSISEDRLERALSASSLAAEEGEEELADCSGRTYALPTVKGDHSDLKAISPQTMTDLLEGKYDDRVENFYVVDCRYPYEYNGGHIQTGQNLYTEEMVLESFFGENYKASTNPDKRTVIIFHCEFSKERGPRLMRFLRKHDRKENAEAYPFLQYPEIYLLDGGYKNFYENTLKTHCEPKTYVPMFEKKYASELRFFRRKTKSWAGNDPRATVGLQRTRTGLKF